MQRRDALKAMAGRKLGPMMDSIPIEVSSLGTGLPAITGPGGNITALTGPDGIILVDSFVPAKGAELAPIVHDRFNSREGPAGHPARAS